MKSVLPKIELPIYEIRLPSNDKEIRVRPFTVKEEKLLLLAVESGETTEIVNTTKQVINNCLVDSDIDVNTLPFFDVDFLLIFLRAKSIGENITVNFRCENEIDNNVCYTPFEVNIDISNCQIHKDDNIKKDIKVSSDILVKMKYPNYFIIKQIMDSKNTLDRKIKIIAACIDKIIKGDQSYSSKDITPNQMIDFVEGLTEQQYKELEKFVDNFPYFYYAINHTCTNCGFEHSMQYKDLSSFF